MGCSLHRGGGGGGEGEEIVGGGLCACVWHGRLWYGSFPSIYLAACTTFTHCWRPLTHPQVDVLSKLDVNAGITSATITGTPNNKGHLSE